MSDPARKAPRPLFDTLEQMENPFRQPPTTVTHAVDDAPDGAVKDFRRACEFLYSYRGSADTFMSYRRELEHFLQWSWLFAGKTLPDVHRDDIESFIEFTREPPPAWIGIENVPRYLEQQGERVANPRWRPYVVVGRPAADDGPPPYLLSQSALQSCFAVLSTFFNFLVQEGHCGANPVAGIRQKSKFLRKRQGSNEIRRLSPLQWDFVIETAERMAREDPKRHERTLFIMTALFAMYLRISELVESERWAPQMGHFQQDLEGNWWFVTVGKGNKERDISVSDEMLEVLKRYRRSRGLPSLPAPGETSPLIHKTRGKGGITSTRQIRGIVQQCFTRAQETMRAEGFTEEAERLSAATVHWLRHTGISEDVKHRPREHVRDDAGHGSSAITDRYIDVERAERHASARRKRVRGP